MNNQQKVNIILNRKLEGELVLKALGYIPAGFFAKFVFDNIGPALLITEGEEIVDIRAFLLENILDKGLLDEISEGDVQRFFSYMEDIDDRGIHLVAWGDEEEVRKGVHVAEGQDIHIYAVDTNQGHTLIATGREGVCGRE